MEGEALNAAQLKLFRRLRHLEDLCRKPDPMPRKGKWPPCCMGVAAMGPWHCTCAPVERYLEEMIKIEKRLGLDRYITAEFDPANSR